MNPDYITLSNGIKYRVEANFNAIVAYCRETGNTDLSKLDAVASMSLEEVPHLLYACIAEGEKLDGRELTLSKDELTSLFRPANIGQFFQIFADQSRVVSSKKTTGTQGTASSTDAKKKTWLKNPFRRRPSA